MHAAAADVLPPDDLLDGIPAVPGRRVRLPTLGGLVIGFSASGIIHRSDFNFGSKFAPPMLGDDVKFTIDVEADQK